MTMLKGGIYNLMSYLPFSPPSVPGVSYSQIYHFLHFIFLIQIFACITKNAKGSSDVLIGVLNPSTGIFTCFSKSALMLGLISFFCISEKLLLILSLRKKLLYK